MTAEQEVVGQIIGQGGEAAHAFESLAPHRDGRAERELTPCSARAEQTSGPNVDETPMFSSNPAKVFAFVPR